MEHIDSKYLAFSETTYHILVALVQPNHGYGVMKQVEESTGGEMQIGAGTLYGAFQVLEKDGLIQKAGEEERRKYYSLTAKGKKILAYLVRRVERMTQNGLKVIDLLE
jgi:DNA-binding PadR family transcriptional regulator